LDEVILAVCETGMFHANYCSWFGWQENSTLSRRSKTVTEQTSVFKTAEGGTKSIAAYDAVLAHWPVPFEERDLPTRFGTTHLIVSGSAEARKALDFATRLSTKRRTDLISDAGHMLNSDQPKLVNARILEFCQL